MKLVMNCNNFMVRPIHFSDTCAGCFRSTLTIKKIGKITKRENKVQLDLYCAVYKIMIENVRAAQTCIHYTNKNIYKQI